MDGTGSKKGKKRDIVQMCFPQTRPEISMASYYYSKQNTSFYTHFPNEDECSQNYYMDKFLALRDLNTAEKRLAGKRAEAAEMVKKLDLRWSALHEGQRALKENFKKFDEFLRENQEKRERATRKIQEELALQNERRDMLLKLENRMDYYHRIQAMLVKKIKEYRLYEDYLTNTAKESSDFKNVSAVINRFQALIEAKKSAAERNEREAVAMQKARGEMCKLFEDKVTTLLGLRSLVGGLNSRYEVARLNSLTWETSVQGVRQQILLECQQRKGMMSAARQLYRMMCRRKHTAIAPVDFEQKMLFIKHTLTQLHWIRNVKFAGLINMDKEQYWILQMGKEAAQRITLAEEEGEGGLGKGHPKIMTDKSTMGIFAYLLYENHSKMSRLTEHSGRHPPYNRGMANIGSGGGESHVRNIHRAKWR